MTGNMQRTNTSIETQGNQIREDRNGKKAWKLEGSEEGREGRRSAGKKRSREDGQQRRRELEKKESKEGKQTVKQRRKVEKECRDEE